MKLILAGDAPFASLYNTNTVVLIAFLVFVGFLVFKGVPKLLGGLLDKRADGIRAELDEAKRLREEAQEIYADYERKLQEVKAEADEIVKSAKAQAEASAKEAHAKLAAQMERRIAAGKEQIASAEAAVEREIRGRAAAIAIEATRNVLGDKLSGKAASGAIADAIKDIEARA